MKWIKRGTEEGARENGSKVALFDLGSTLVEGPINGPAKRIAETMELPNNHLARLEEIIFLQKIDNPEILCNKLKSEFPNQARMKLRDLETIWNLQLREASEIEGATEAVSAFKQAGFSLGVISNIWKPYFVSFKANCPKIFRQIDSFFLSYELGMRKPNRAIFETALGCFTVSPKNAVMIGDSYEMDIRPALSLGMRTIWVLSRPIRELNSIRRVQNYEDPKPDFTVLSIEEINPEIARVH